MVIKEYFTSFEDFSNPMAWNQKVEHDNVTRYIHIRYYRF